MEPTSLAKRAGATQLNSYWSSAAVLVLLALLPYASYVSLAGLGGLMVMTVYRHGDGVRRILYRSGWWVIAIAMVFTLTVAKYPGEAALQLSNFLPFMVFLGTIATVLPRLATPFRVLEQWATALLVASIPISTRALVEYGLKAPTIESQLSGLTYFDWLYGQADYGHRADSVFGHPNVLASYLVILLGLGLGLTLQRLRCLPANQHRRFWWQHSGWIYTATILLPVGIFCSGSRNGVLVAIAQLLVCAWLMRRNRLVMIAGTAAMIAMVVGVATWGIGGRNLFEAFSTITLRLDVWQLAIDMIQQRPWLGSGLGSYRLSYVPYSVEPYDVVEHAHNLWLMLAAELGLPLMLGLTAVVGRTCWRGAYALITGPFAPQQRYMLAGYVLAFTGCSLFALFDVAFYDARVNLLGWLALAVIQAMPTLAARMTPHSPGPRSPKSA